MLPLTSPLMLPVRLPPFVEALGHGIYAVDTGFHRPRFDAAYLLVHEGRAAFIDTGTNFAVPRLLQALAATGLNPGDVDWVIPTHVHLDHAGGAGLLMRECPNARLFVHPRGARHLIDPTALYEGALAVYGSQAMARDYGTLLGVDAARVDTSHDGATLQLAGRPLLFYDTPGHARHHHCIWDAASRGWFTGDTFGLSYREFDSAHGAWILPSSTPVQFDPAALSQSITRLCAVQPECMYLTHYSRVADVPRLAGLLLAQIEQMAQLGRRTPAGPQRHAALKAGLLAIYADSLAANGGNFTPDYVAQWLQVDVELNAQGLAIWLDKETPHA